MEKGKNGHLNPAFHLKVVGPINKASGHKGVRAVCVLKRKKKRFRRQKIGVEGDSCSVFMNNRLSMRLTFILNGLIFTAACYTVPPPTSTAFHCSALCLKHHFIMFLFPSFYRIYLIGRVSSSRVGYICHLERDTKGARRETKARSKRRK